MVNEILAALVPAAFVSLVALAVVLTLRLPLRRLFGSAQAYAIWSLIPLSLAALLLPAHDLPHIVVLTAAGPAPLSALQTQIADMPQTDWRTAAVALWLAGVVLSACWFCLQHRRFMRSLGRLERRDGLHYAQSLDIGPAMVGILKPMIVVPRDFDQRYSEEERTLIAKHERAHIRRGDACANLVCALLQCLIWFNPIVHLAARRFRFDQELACDATVIKQHPAARRSYAEAMLKTQLAAFGSPIGCHWPSRHPLQERIVQLNANMPRAARRACGAILVGCITLAGTCGAWATQGKAVPGPRQGETYRLTLNIVNQFGTLGKEAETSIDAPSMEVKANKPVILLRAGETASIMQSEGDVRMGYDLVVTPVRENVVELSMAVSRNNEVLGKPHVLVHLDEPARISGKFGSNGDLDYSLDFTISKAVQSQK